LALSGWAGHRVIRSFADREGFAVAQVFTESPLDSHAMAMRSMIEATAFTEVVAIVVPSWTHLGSVDPLQQRRTRDSLQREAGVPVLSVVVAAAPITRQPVNAEIGLTGAATTGVSTSDHICAADHVHYTGSSMPGQVPQCPAGAHG